MKIGVYAGGNMADPSSGGGFTFQASILNALLTSQQDKHEFYVLVDNQLFDSRSKFVKVVTLQKYIAQNNTGLLKKLFYKVARFIDRIIVKKKYKSFVNRAVHEHNLELIWFMTPAAAYVSAPYFYTVWDLQHRLQSYFPEVSIGGDRFEKREHHFKTCIQRAARIIIGNQAGKEEIMTFYGMPQERIVTIPFPVPDFACNPKISSSDSLKKYNLSEPFIFYPAQFWPHKNHVLILHAIKILQKKYNRIVTIVFTGADKGNKTHVEQCIKNLGLENQVHFLGFVSIEVLRELYKKAHALVYPSFFGPDNIPPLEAFALGCPVLAARVSGSQYQLEGAALLFDPKNEYDLAEKIMQLDTQENLRETLITHGKTRAHAFSSHDYINEIIKHIDDFAPIRRCWSSTERYREL